LKTESVVQWCVCR